MAIADAGFKCMAAANDTLQVRPILPHSRTSVSRAPRQERAKRSWLPASGETWLVVLAGLGVFLAADDQTSVVAVLPAMIEDIGLAQDQFYSAAWLVNGYILGYVVAMPLIGRVSDTYGHGRVFAASLGLFIAGSCWVALSDDLTMLVVARAVQAVGAGAVVPVSMAIVLEHAAPGRRAIGLGAMAAASEGGALLGPLWGGGIAEVWDWRGVFWINLPLCLPLVVAIWRLAPGGGSQSRGVDFLGGSLLGAALVCLTIALTDDPIAPRPAAFTMALYAGAAVFGALFLLSQRRLRDPMLRLASLARRGVAAALATDLLAGATLIVAMVNVPLFTNLVLGESPLQGGLNLMRLTLAVAVAALAGGYLTQRYGPALTASLGLLLAGAGYLGISRWDEGPGWVALTVPMLVAGFGFGLIIAPVNASALDAAHEDERATLASLLTVARLLGALVGVALLTTRGLGGFYADAGLIPFSDPQYVERVIGLQVESFRETYIVAAIVCFVSVVPAMFLGFSGPRSFLRVIIGRTRSRPV